MLRLHVVAASTGAAREDDTLQQCKLFSRGARNLTVQEQSVQSHDLVLMHMLSHRAVHYSQC